ncbi:hypothetical protein [Sphingosinicella sp. BN140058]|uniref:hypothetical protein n=1 Tax=Sphingosinicella sp. BN140058 TaxID=1892855 RepID=UPI00101221CA|nr:hypothetical protein [Sphingosinicella sp. BN140058]QAY80229.1 hypothetical protein ETR14_26665 [Sphingosinicella sp. BN140058]
MLRNHRLADVAHRIHAAAPQYAPLLVTPVASDKRKGEVVAFIGQQVCFFERGSRMPLTGQPIEVMITRALYHRNASGHFDRDRVRALVIRVVTQDDMLIAHDGFECSGSMCRTTAAGAIGHGVTTLTPGRTDIFEADNVNSRFCGREDVPVRPGRVWIKRADTRRDVIRIEGLARLEDAQFAPAVRK